jgi:hypothetical protein
VKYLVSNDCKNNEGAVTGKLEFEAEKEPKPTNPSIIEQALNDAVKINKSGMGGLSITSISLAS